MEFTEKQKVDWMVMWGFIPGTPEADAAWNAKLAMHASSADSHFVKGDVAPYRSMITGQIIDGRRDHREHLKRHNVVEVGNDLDNYRRPSPNPDRGLKETIARQVYEKLRY